MEDTEPVEPTTLSPAGTPEPISLLQWVKLGEIDGEAAGDESSRGLAMSDDGTIVAIGAPQNSGAGKAAGHVRVFRNFENVWIQIGADIDGTAPADNLGTSVGMDREGRRIVAGGNGFVQVYDLDDQEGNWKQFGDTIPGPYLSSKFGATVSMSSDGRTFAVGAPLPKFRGPASPEARRLIDDDNSTSVGVGIVQVFTERDGEFRQLGGDIMGVSKDDELGCAVSLSKNGRMLAVGGPGFETGYARIYRNVGSAWLQVGEIQGEEDEDENGWSVALSEDGLTVAVGARRHDAPDGLDDAGYVRVFQFREGSFVQVGQSIVGEAFNDGSGSSLAISNDGDAIVIGSSFNNFFTGHARIFRNVANVWTQIGPDIDGLAMNDLSGTVVMSGIGNIVGVGAFFNNGVNGTDSGHVRVFTLGTDTRR